MAPSDTLAGADAPSTRVAVFGGSFNPPHVAHVLAAAYVLACEEIDRVLVVPAFRHPFSKSLAPFDDRVEMCRLAFVDLSRVEVSRVEGDLGGESRTVRTLEHLAQMHPRWSMRLVVGADVVHEMDRWSDPARVRALAPPLVLGRVGYSLPPGASVPHVLPEVSSTAIRQSIAEGDVATKLLPTRVRDYIASKNLYR